MPNRDYYPPEPVRGRCGGEAAQRKVAGGGGRSWEPTIRGSATRNWLGAGGFGLHLRARPERRDVPSLVEATWSGQGQRPSQNMHDEICLKNRVH